jgi:hypothetical protein
MIEAGARFEFLHGVHYDDFQYKKFAELIINDCLACADRMADSLEKDEAHKEALGASWAALAIARRYGLS